MDVFLKKNLDTLLLYWKYDYKIILKEKQKPGQTFLYKMSFEEHDAVKQYLDSDFAKKFIQASQKSLFVSSSFFQEAKYLILC